MRSQVSGASLAQHSSEAEAGTEAKGRNGSRVEAGADGEVRSEG